MRREIIHSCLEVLRHEWNQYKLHNNLHWNQHHTNANTKHHTNHERGRASNAPHSNPQRNDTILTTLKNALGSTRGRDEQRVWRARSRLSGSGGKAVYGAGLGLQSDIM
ncbi:hypothetical protein E2C01_070092 [Portunus trituberculatus]|uniref:Uncharacterized protein n=1 Tax=Portunus trituberculatus TaxID=210409 RepID=A0A5B7I1C4_PORTR|nr:hypothetical protein [Portunus trituberculatus]